MPITRSGETLGRALRSRSHNGNDNARVTSQKVATLMQRDRHEVPRGRRVPFTHAEVRSWGRSDHGVRVLDTSRKTHTHPTALTPSPVDPNVSRTLTPWSKRFNDSDPMVANVSRTLTPRSVDDHARRGTAIARPASYAFRRRRASPPTPIRPVASNAYVLGSGTTEALGP